MSNIEIYGKIIAVMPEYGGVSKTTGNAWKSRGYVLETLDRVPRKIAFDVIGEERIANLNIKEGETMKVFLDFDAFEHNGRYFNKFKAWKVDRSVDKTEDKQGNVADKQLQAPLPQPSADTLF